MNKTLADWQAAGFVPCSKCGVYVNPSKSYLEDTSKCSSCQDEWRFNGVVDSGSGHIAYVARKDGRDIARFHNIEDAKRAAACVNALAGLNPAGVAGVVEALRGLMLASSTMGVGSLSYDRAMERAKDALALLEVKP